MSLDKRCSSARASFVEGKETVHILCRGMRSACVPKAKATGIDLVGFRTKMGKAALGRFTTRSHAQLCFMNEIVSAMKDRLG